MDPRTDLEIELPQRVPDRERRKDGRRGAAEDRDRSVASRARDLPAPAVDLAFHDRVMQA
jgi:hypothetical protein